MRNFGAVGPKLPEAAQARVLEMLQHRGPDGHEYFVDDTGQITLLHTGLSVIDLETGAQPLESENGDVVLAANGEIYDFEAIRGSLEAKGYKFKTKSDSEVILVLYQEYGVACLEHLSRRNSLSCYYDKSKQLFLAARDRFGIKPLYLSRTSTAASFSHPR